MRSIATRHSGREVPAALPEMIDAVKAAGFDLVIVETPGIGQGDAGIVPYVDLSVYVMTPEFGAASQLEKIDMLDFADVVVINKFDRPGRPRCAARRRQADPAQPPGVRRDHRRDAGVRHASRPASTTGCDGGLSRDRPPVERPRLGALGPTARAVIAVKASEPGAGIVPAARRRYLAEIAETRARLSPANVARRCRRPAIVQAPARRARVCWRSAGTTLRAASGRR